MSRVDTPQAAVLVHWVADRSDPMLRAACGADHAQSPLRAFRSTIVSCPKCREIMASSALRKETSAGEDAEKL